MQSSDHFERMLRERGIDAEWAEATIADPVFVQDHEDGTRSLLEADRGLWRALAESDLERPGEQESDRILRQEGEP